MRGAVRFMAGGVEYSLRYTVNRLCDLEEASGKTVMEYAALLAKPGAAGMREVRTLFQFGLDCTKEQAGDILQDIGLHEGMQLASKALAAAFDIPLDGKAAAGKPKAGAA